MPTDLSNKGKPQGCEIISKQDLDIFHSLYLYHKYLIQVEAPIAQISSVQYKEIQRAIFPK